MASGRIKDLVSELESVASDFETINDMIGYAMRESKPVGELTLDEIIKRVKTLEGCLASISHLTNPTSSTSSTKSTNDETLARIFERLCESIDLDFGMVSKLLEIDGLYAVGDIVTRALTDEKFSLSHAVPFPVLTFVYLKPHQTLLDEIEHRGIGLKMGRYVEPRYSVFSCKSSEGKTLPLWPSRFVSRGKNGGLDGRSVIIHTGFCMPDKMSVSKLKCDTFDFLKTFYRKGEFTLLDRDAVLSKTHYQNETLLDARDKYSNRGYSFTTEPHAVNMVTYPDHLTPSQLK
jgi:hypothetical protein